MIAPAAELATRLTATRVTLLDLIRPLRQVTLTWTPPDGGPAILAILAALPAAERHHRSQALRIRFDAWGLATPYAAEPVPAAPAEETFESLESERRITLFALGELTESDWVLRCRHAFLGEVSAGWILEEILRNERRAIRDIRAVLAEFPLSGGR
jgi:hypothetical protein